MPKQATVKYDSALIYKFADRLYAQARTVLVTYPILIGLVFAAVAYGLAATGHVASNDGRQASTSALIAAVLGAGIGYVIAIERAYQLRLRAQLALCNVAIEENTGAHRAHEVIR